MTSMGQAAKDYLALRRRVGHRLERHDRLLFEFVQFLRRAKQTRLTTESALAWAQTAVSPNAAARRLSVVRQFAEFLKLSRPRTEIPPKDLLPYRRRRQIPYIYSDGDVRALMAATRILRGRLIGATYSTLFGLLATTGMRVGEATALDRSHFDPVEGTLTVWKGKQGRSRRLILHATTTAALQAYARRRDRVIPHPRSSTFFLSEAGTSLLGQNVHATFSRLLRSAGLAERRPRRPRIHDLRHSFAVHTVTDWYRAGRDVERMLPRLSTYLGHVSPVSTYWYLTGTPTLLSSAVKRLEQAMGRST
jgi:integrase/recombinase XerD